MLPGAPGRIPWLRHRFYNRPSVFLAFMVNMKWTGGWWILRSISTLWSGIWLPYTIWLRSVSPLNMMEEMYVTTYAMSSFNNGDDHSSQQSPHKPSSPVPPICLGPLTDLFGEGGLWPPQTSAGACWWWGWRSHRPGAPQGFGSSSCQTHPHALLQPPCLHWDKNSRQRVGTKTSVQLLR